MVTFVSPANPMVPFIGTIYRHYKGDHYKVLAVSRDSETKELRVIYTKDGDDVPWDRLLTGTDDLGKPCGWADVAVSDRTLCRFSPTYLTEFPDVES